MVVPNETRHASHKSFFPEGTFFMSLGRFKTSSGVYSGAICKMHNIENIVYNKNHILSADFRYRDCGLLFGFLTDGSLRMTDRIHVNMNRKDYHAYPSPTISDQCVNESDRNVLVAFREALSKVPCDVTLSEKQLTESLIEMLIQRTNIVLNSERLKAILPEYTFLKSC